MAISGLEHIDSQPENPFSALISGQKIAIIPSFSLESGETLYNVPVAYTTRGTLAEDGKNVMIICHALTGSADVGDWWGPLLGGEGKAFDVTRFHVVCLNSLGSPYGTASPVTNKDGDPRKGRYGPEFPLTTIRDDVRLHRRVLDSLGVKQVATVIGGSMGGMLALEWAFIGGEDYVRSIVAIATSARHSAWCISWGEAQRQSIYSDPKYDDGYYTFDDPPAAGLGAARMSALLTYRSRDSFESRFGRTLQEPNRLSGSNLQATVPPSNDPPTSPSESHWAIHNHGHRNAKSVRTPSLDSASYPNPFEFTDPQFSGTQTHTAETPSSTNPRRPHQPPSTAPSSHSYFSAQSYLRHQAQKFVHRFDSNCYISLTRKLDTHDLSRARISGTSLATVSSALATIVQPVLVLGIESDGLFTFAEQRELAEGIGGNARLERIESMEGHDAFLLQFGQVNRMILGFLGEAIPDVLGREPVEGGGEGSVERAGGIEAGKGSMVGEAEGEGEDFTAW